MPLFTVGSSRYLTSYSCMHSKAIQQL